VSGPEPLATSDRFLGLADVYENYRPGYPPEAIAAILAGLPPHPAVVDIGAGTGISTRALQAAGARAIAIDPNDEMRAVAVARGSDARPGTATATGLDDGCCDAVACFQAFHWFATDAAMLEFRRILRPGGRIALVWNERDTNDPFTAEYSRLERHYCDSEGRAAIDFPDEIALALLAKHGFTGVRKRTFPNVQRTDVDGVIGRMRSTSYAPKSPDTLEALFAALRSAHARFCDGAGYVTFHYLTDVTLAEKGA